MRDMDQQKTPQEKNLRNDDDPRQANESGEPQESGRSRGHVVDREHPAGQADQTRPGEMQSDRESGRQDAMSD